MINKLYDRAYIWQFVLSRTRGKRKLILLMDVIIGKGVGGGQLWGSKDNYLKYLICNMR